MKIKTCLAIGGWLLLAIAFSQQQRPGRKTHIGFPATSSDVRIKLINDGYQAALNDLTATEMKTIKGKDADGNPITFKMPLKFGLRRTPTIMVLHNGVLRDTNVSVFETNMAYELKFYAVSRFGKPLEAGKMRIHKDVGPVAGSLKSAQTREIVGFADKALPQLLTRDRVSGHIGQLEATAMPLRLSSKECTKCHTSSSIRDPLAIMVYTVKRKTG